MTPKNFCQIFKMQKFLLIETNPNSKVPRIQSLLDRISGDKNEGFYKLANSLFNSSNLNPTYSLVALKDIVNLSPLNTDNEYNEEQVNPQSSFKWLFLIYSLTVKKLSQDQEIEQGKIEFVFSKFLNYITKSDYSKPFVLPFICGILCTAAHIIDKLEDNNFPQNFISDEAYEIFYKLISLEQIPEIEKTIVTSDFSESSILSFCLPLSLEFISPMNVFHDIKSLLATSVIRLLIRILPKTLPKNIEQFQNIIQPFAVKSITKQAGEMALVLLFNGDENAAFRFSDKICYSSLVKVIEELYKTSKQFTTSLSYLDSIRLSKKLKNLQELTVIRPKFWIEYLQEEADLKNILCSLATSGYDQDFIVATVSLLRIGEVKVNHQLILFLLQLLISSSLSVLREESSKLLLLNYEQVIDEIPNILPEVSNCGSRSETFFSFLKELIPKLGDKATFVLNSIQNSIIQENNSLKKLPNSFIYSQISQYIDLSASYLDTRPCMICNNPEITATRYPLCDIREYIKFTHDQMFVKLNTPLILQSLDLSFYVKKPTRLPRIVKFYVSSQELNDTIELKSDKPQWTHVCDLKFEKDATSATVNLPLSLFATCIQFHYTDFWEEPEGTRQNCPMCHNGTPDPRSGICPNCHENIYQCRDCRNINYGHLDGFLCSECGSSRYVSFETHITAIRSFSHTHICSENECDSCLAKADELLAEAHKYFGQLSLYRKDIDNVISPTNQATVSEKTSKLLDLYNSKCRNVFNQLTQVVQHVCSIRSAVGKYKNRISNTLSHADFNSCYNCRKTYLSKAIGFLGSLTDLMKIEKVDIPKLLIDFSDNPLFGPIAINSLTNYCRINTELTNRIIEWFIKSLPNPSHALVNLVCSLEQIDDNQRNSRLKMLVNSLASCVEYLNTSPSFTPLVFQPVFEAVCKSKLIIRDQNRFTKTVILNSILKNRKLEKSFNLLELFNNDLIKTLLVDCNSESVRELMSEMLIETSNLSLNLKRKIFDIVYEIIKNKKDFSDEHLQAYEVLQHILTSNRMIKISAYFSGFFDTITKILESEVNKVVSTEGALVLDLNIGIGIHTLMDLVNVFVHNQAITRFIILKKPEIAEKLIQCYFKLKSLIVQRSKHLDDSINSLKEFAMMMMAKEFILDKDDEIVKPISIIEETNSATQSMDDMFPEDDNGYEDHYDDYGDVEDEEPQPNIPSQNNEPSSPPKKTEEEPQVTSENKNGPELMMKAAAHCVKLCPEIAIRELSSIVFPVKVARNVPVIFRKYSSQEDFLPGRLPSSAVMSSKIGTLMKHIKNKICQDLGMLSMIEDDHSMELLVDNNIISLDLNIQDVYEKVWEPHHGNSNMVVVCRIQGFSGEATEPMITSFPREESEEEAPEIKYAYTTVLIESGGLQQLLGAADLPLPQKSLESLSKLLDALVKVPQNLQAMHKMNTVEKLFNLMQRLIEGDDANLFRSILSITSVLINSENPTFTNPDEKIKFIFVSLEKKLVHDNNSLVSPILSLVPRLAAGSKVLMGQVVGIFLEKIKPEGDVNLFEKPVSLFMLNGFAEFARAIPSTPEGNEVRNLLMQHKLIDQGFAYLEKVFPVGLSITSPEWQNGVNEPSVAAVLKLLAGLMRGYETAQKEFDSNRILYMISLSNVASTTNIGEFASQVISSACESPSIVAETIEGIKNKIAQEAKNKAQQDREEAIAKAKEGMNNELLEMLNNIGDDTDWECVICKEPPEEHPEAPLYLYVYSNRMGDYNNTATHFILVHKHCHQNTKTTDQRGRRTLDEWEAAKVRNCERPCNALFPLQTPSLSTADYLSSLLSYVSDQCRGPTDVFKAVWFDVTQHIKNFATNTNISFANGGGSVPNVVALIPFLIHAGFVALGENTKPYESKLERMLASGEDPESAASLALWMLNVEEFRAVKEKLLLNLLKADQATTFEKAKKALIFIIFISRAFEMLYNDSGIEAQFKDGNIVVAPKDKQVNAKNVHDLVVDNALNTKNDWIMFGEEMEDEIMTVTDLKSALIRAEINTGSSTPEEWLAKQFQ